MSRYRKKSEYTWGGCLEQWILSTIVWLATAVAIMLAYWVVQSVVGAEGLPARLTPAQGLAASAAIRILKVVL